METLSELQKFRILWDIQRTKKVSNEENKWCKEIALEEFGEEIQRNSKENETLCYKFI